jgi:hypothetical protein
MEPDRGRGCAGGDALARWPLRASPSEVTTEHEVVSEGADGCGSEGGPRWPHRRIALGAPAGAGASGCSRCEFPTRGGLAASLRGYSPKWPIEIGIAKKRQRRARRSRSAVEPPPEVTANDVPLDNEDRRSLTSRRSPPISAGFDSIFSVSGVPGRTFFTPYCLDLYPSAHPNVIFAGVQ